MNINTESPDIGAAFQSVANVWNRAISGDVDFTTEDVFSALMSTVTAMIKASSDEDEVKRRLSLSHEILAFAFPKESLKQQLRSVITGKMRANNDGAGRMIGNAAIDTLVDVGAVLTEIFASIDGEQNRETVVSSFIETFPAAVANTRKEADEK